ncbi:MAG: sulfate permease [Gemmatimonadetes bacterium]|jgi:sulfate permease, SulP family|nr:sulfate permease [Gemmatimonadota bacterium]
MRGTAELRGILHRLLPYTPFTRWMVELRDGAVLRADVIAGITVAMILIPQAMAYAQLAGLPAFYGLYAAFLPPAVAALFGSSRQLATGPVAMASLLSVGILQTFVAPGTGDFITYSILLALMVGMLRICLGALRLGALVNLLSRPVVIGFTNAAVLVIATSQMHHLFGVSAVRGDYHFQTVWRTIEVIAGNARWESLGMASLATAILLGLRNRASGRLPYVLIAVVATTLTSWLVGYGGKVVGEIPRGLPSFRAPVLDLRIVPELAMGAITITLVGLMEAMAIAKTIATKTKQQIDINQELIGQGMANLVGSFFQSYAVSGSFSRSAVNYASGARTGFSSVVTSLVVMITLLWFTPLLYHLPQATLGAIIVISVISLIRIKPIVTAWRVQRQDGIIAVVTFLGTLVLAPALHQGILIGVALSLLSYLLRTMRPRVVFLARHPDGSLHGAEIHGLEPDQKIAIIRFDGRLYFGDSSYFEDKVLEIVAHLPGLQYLIVDAGGINQVDATGEQTLRNLVGRLRGVGIDVFVTGAKKQFREVLERTGCMDYIGRDHFFGWNQSALEHVWSKLGAEYRARCPLNSSHPSEDRPFADGLYI